MHTCDADGKGWGTCDGQVKPKTEDCATAEDDDCDGTPNQASAGCVCAVGSMQQCYTFATGTPGTGICQYGVQSCNSLGTGWDGCTGDVGPQAVEDCGTPVDDNCDSQINENCSCTPGASAYCYSGAVGTDNNPPCKGGMHQCNPDGHGYGPCVGEVDPVAEDCATQIDENCNGVVNEPAAGCVCTPGTTASCYNGPPGTAGVGICAAGLKTCDATGKAYLPGCASEVDPGVEDCSNSTDEDCNGTFCTQSLWSHDYGDASSQRPRALTVDAAGNTYIVGTFYSTLAAGNLAPLVDNVAPLDNNAFLLKLDSGGTPTLAAQFGDIKGQDAETVATDSQGNIIVAGSFSGAVVFGGTLLGGAANTGIEGFVAKLDPSGNPIWAKGFGTAGKSTWTHTVTVDASDNIYIAGDFNAPVDFGLGATAPTGTQDAYVVKYDSAGTAKFAKHFGASGLDTFGEVISVDKFGAIALQGYFNGTVVFGPGVSITANAGGRDDFVAKLDNTGAPIFANAFGNGSRVAVFDAKFDNNGDIVAAGYFGGNLHPSWWGLCPSMMSPAGTNNSYLVRLGGMGGTCKAAAQFGNSVNAGATTKIRRIAIDSSNSVMAGGQCYGAFNIGANLNCSGDAFLLRTDAAFSTIWSRNYGASTGVVVGIASAGSSTVRLLVENTASINFGNGALSTNGQEDVAIAAIVTR
jgi:hypothetical protein